MDLAEQIVKGVNKKPVPNPIKREELYNTITNSDLKNHQKTALYLAYLTGARASELINIRANDFEEVTGTDLLGNPKRQLLVTVKTLKKRRGSLERRLAIASEDKTEKKMLNGILKHRTALIELDALRSRLVPVSRQAVWQWAQKIVLTTRAVDQRKRKVIEDYSFKMYPHYLRHCRASHLVNDYGFEAFSLQQYMGWSSVEMAKIYVTLDWHKASRLLLTPKPEVKPASPQPRQQ